MLRAALVLATAASLIGVAPARAQTFFVSRSGNDASAGTRPSTAWRSLRRVDGARLRPGDRVLFEGGATFAGTLSPAASGSSGHPILFASYGRGRARITRGIALRSRSWLFFRRLRVDPGDWRRAGSIRGLSTSATGSGVQHLVVEGCELGDVLNGIVSANHLDTAWWVSGNVIRRTRDSGIMIFDASAPGEIGGSDMTFVRNTIADTGLDSSIPWPKHAVYDIGTDLTWRANVLRGFSQGGFSLRAHGNRLVGNVIEDGPYGIYFSPYDATPGTTLIAYNRISGITGSAVELAGSGTAPDVESFVIANNSISARDDAPGIRVVGTSGSLSIVNNLVVTQAGPLFRIDRLPGRGLVESHNLWWAPGARSWGYLGAAYFTLRDYRAASRQGAGDTSVDPRLAAGMVPTRRSPAVDAGTPLVPGLAAYSPRCARLPYHYCGREPDIGSVERMSAGSRW